MVPHGAARTDQFSPAFPFLSSMLGALRRLIAWFRHRHDFQPTDVKVQDDYSGATHLVTVRRCACGAVHSDDHGSISGKILPALLILAAVNQAQAQSITRTPELTAAIQSAAASVQPCNGKVTFGIIGKSNDERYQQDMWTRWSNTAVYGAHKNPSVVWDRGAMSGKDIEQWKDPNNQAWANFAAKISGLGASSCSLQWLGAGFSKINIGDTLPAITAADLDAALTVALTKYPSIKGITLWGINKTFCSTEPNCLVSSAAAQHDDETMDAYKGVRTFIINGVARSVAIDYVPLWQLAWVPSMLESDMVHENLTTGVQFGGSFIMGQLRNDADAGYCWLWNDQPCATTPPPPPPPPVSVPLSGTLTKEGTSCTFATEYGSVMVPTSWYEGL